MTDQRSPEFFPAIRRARIDTLNIYEVSEFELQLLERGSPDSLLLNFAIFLISVSLSFLAAIMTSAIESTRVFIVFVIIVVVGLISGAVLLAFWAWYRRSSTTIFQQIRNRMPPEGTPIIDIDRI